jgi:hypothetical protein
MPAISLVVCIYQQRDLLERLIREARGCYDELLAVHDGPDAVNIKELVEKWHGQFVENARIGSLEGQSPFAWAKAEHDWILRLDADEFPSEEMKKWLQRFREAPEPEGNISGYTCIWPLWNGHRTVSKRYAPGRIFLFNRQRVRFFGMVEQVPIADARWQALEIILEHRPRRKSYGLANLLFRPQAYHWRRMIAQALLGKPTDLPSWRWTSEKWPRVWEEIRMRPLRTAFYRLLVWPLFTLRDMWRTERRIFPVAALSGGIHHCLIALEYFRLKYFKSRV